MCPARCQVAIDASTATRGAPGAAPPPRQCLAESQPGSTIGSRAPELRQRQREPARWSRTGLPPGPGPSGCHPVGDQAARSPRHRPAAAGARTHRLRTEPGHRGQVGAAARAQQPDRIRPDRRARYSRRARSAVGGPARIVDTSAATTAESPRPVSVSVSAAINIRCGPWCSRCPCHRRSADPRRRRPSVSDTTALRPRPPASAPFARLRWRCCHWAAQSWAPITPTGGAAQSTATSTT